MMLKNYVNFVNIAKIIKVTLEPEPTVLSTHCALFVPSFYMGQETPPHTRITFELHCNPGKSAGLFMPISNGKK